MNSGLFSIGANPRQPWIHVSAQRDITTAEEMLFEVPEARRCLGAFVQLVCLVANNGYEIDEIIPLENIWFNSADNNDGAPLFTIRYAPGVVRVRLSADTQSFFNPTAAVTNGALVNINFAEWQMRIVAFS